MVGAAAHSAGDDDLAGADDMGHPATPYTKRGIHRPGLRRRHGGCDVVSRDHFQRFIFACWPDIGAEQRTTGNSRFGPFPGGRHIMLAGAAKFIFQDDEDDKPPPDWLGKLEAFTPRQALRAGFGWLMVSPKQWVFVLTAVAVIFSAYLSVMASLLNYFVFTILIQIVCFVLIGVHVVLPERSAALLHGLFNWLKKNKKPLAIGLFTILGLFFLIKGAMGLVG